MKVFHHPIHKFIKIELKSFIKCLFKMVGTLKHLCFEKIKYFLILKL